MAWNEEEALALETLSEDSQAALRRLSAKELSEMEPKLNAALGAVFVWLGLSLLSSESCI